MGRENEPQRIHELPDAEAEQPCWCGQDKLYIDCCKRPDSFKIPGGEYSGPTTKVFKNGKWHDAGITLNAVIGGMDARDVQEDLEKVIGKFSVLAGSEEAKDLLRDLKHKMYGVRFHAQSIEKRIGDEEQKIRKGTPPPAGAGWHRFDPAIVFHFEALLLQLKAALDIFMRLVRHAFPQGGVPGSFKSTGDPDSKIVGGKAIKAMRKANLQLGDYFEHARENWIQYAVTLRDRIAHRSRLKNLSSFVQRAHEGGGQVIIEYPSIPSGMRVDEYVMALDANLAVLVEDALEMLVDRLKKN